MPAILKQEKLVCQAELCDFPISAPARETCRAVDKAQIAARIDRLISAMAKNDEKDKEINQSVADDLKVSVEAVRAWRKGINFPRLDKLDSLCEYLKRQQIEARPEYILFGFQPKEVHIRERIADDGDELDLLRIFRRANPEGQGLILDTAKALQEKYQLNAKLVRLEGRKRSKRH